ncbi:HEPN domain-containing protein [Metallibacterium sp.]|uniref:HEPN domain-containing protein n=1 Tax=Metallibacterium sp. TaxID=2940281 RepID=UPI0023206A6B|nr:HEPN domain-containing protein [Metallibacterium sp.]MDA8383238.1 HEPN domain-containing protein [Betaproteobacteria bacterium]
MSKLRTAQGDDHPDAALKHLLDAQALFGQSRADGAGYLSGYVVECALKSIWHLETGTSRQGHDLRGLTQAVSAVATVAGAKTARYFKTATSGVPSSVIAQWKPEMRYRAPSMSPGDAQAWCTIADAVYQETVAQMQLDGVI